MIFFRNFRPESPSIFSRAWSGLEKWLRAFGLGPGPSTSLNCTLKFKIQLFELLTKVR